MERKSIKHRLIIVATLLMVGLSLGLGSCTQGSSPLTRSTLEQIVTTHKLKVGYIVFPPSITKDPSTGKLGGHLVETIKEIARLSRWELEFIETDWTGFVAGLNSHRFDVSIAPTFVTIPRASSVYFTKPLFFLGNSAIVRIDDTRFSSINSMDHPKIVVAVTQGEAGDEYTAANFKNAEIIKFLSGDQSLAFQAVVNRRADVALGDAYATKKFALEHPQEVKDLFADSPYNLTPISWAVRKGDDELLNFLNNSLESLNYQGRLLEWEKKAGANWLHLPINRKPTNN